MFGSVIRLFPLRHADISIMFPLENVTKSTVNKPTHDPSSSGLVEFLHRFAVLLAAFPQKFYPVKRPFIKSRAKSLFETTSPTTHQTKSPHQPQLSLLSPATRAPSDPRTTTKRRKATPSPHHDSTTRTNNRTAYRHTQHIFVGVFLLNHIGSISCSAMSLSSVKIPDPSEFRF